MRDRQQFPRDGSFARPDGTREHHNGTLRISSFPDSIALPSRPDESRFVGWTLVPVSQASIYDCRQACCCHRCRGDTSGTRKRDYRSVGAYTVAHIEVVRRNLRGVAGVADAYSGAAETALDQDLRACRSDDPLGKLLTNVRRDTGGFVASSSSFKGPLNDRGVMFAAYVACRHMGLRDLFSGSEMMLQSHVDRHHILPRAQFREKDRSKADNIANIAFVAGEVNRSIGAASPDVYLSKIETEVLESQCIPLDKELWRIERAEEFWRAREELLAEAFNGFLRKMMPGRRL